MSPNGRRAWREWVRRQNLRHKYKQPKGSVCRMARQARRHIPLVPGVMLPKFITARSLVGMSQSARKRLVRFQILHKWWFALQHGTDDAQHLEYVRDVISMRSKYRIGERLRPCQRCEECRGYDDGIGVLHCDGSGVMPARQTAKSYEDDAPLQALRDWSHR